MLLYNVYNQLPVYGQLEVRKNATGFEGGFVDYFVLKSIFEFM